MDGLLHLVQQGGVWAGWTTCAILQQNWFIIFKILCLQVWCRRKNVCIKRYANASPTRQQSWRVERTRLVSRPTWRNTSFNASHLVRPAQLHHRYCLSRDWPLISQDVHSPMPHLSFGTVCLQKSCCVTSCCHQTVWPIPHQRLSSLL